MCLYHFVLVLVYCNEELYGYLKKESELKKKKIMKKKRQYLSMPHAEGVDVLCKHYGKFL